METMTLEQVNACIDTFKVADLNVARQAVLSFAESYAAHLAAQAEWPSEEDVARDVGRRLFNGLLSTQLSEREVRDAVVAALQSVRPPVGVVSDGDVRIADKAYWAHKWLTADERMRAALESYASRHAPTKD